VEAFFGSVQAFEIVSMTDIDILVAAVDLIGVI
jgi:hypothetical protein